MVYLWCIVFVGEWFLTCFMIVYKSATQCHPCLLVSTGPTPNLDSLLNISLKVAVFQILLHHRFWCSSPSICRCCWLQNHHFATFTYSVIHKHEVDWVTGNTNKLCHLTTSKDDVSVTVTRKSETTLAQFDTDNAHTLMPWPYRASKFLTCSV